MCLWESKGRSPQTEQHPDCGAQSANGLLFLSKEEVVDTDNSFVYERLSVRLATSNAVAIQEHRNFSVQVCSSEHRPIL